MVQNQEDDNLPNCDWAGNFEINLLSTESLCDFLLITGKEAKKRVPNELIFSKLR